MRLSILFIGLAFSHTGEFRRRLGPNFTLALLRNNATRFPHSEARNKLPDYFILCLHRAGMNAPNSLLMPHISRFTSVFCVQEMISRIRQFGIL